MITFPVSCAGGSCEIAVWQWHTRNVPVSCLSVRVVLLSPWRAEVPLVFQGLKSRGKHSILYSVVKTLVQALIALMIVLFASRRRAACTPSKYSMWPSSPNHSGKQSTLPGHRRSGPVPAGRNTAVTINANRRTDKVGIDVAASLRQNVAARVLHRTVV